MAINPFACGRLPTQQTKSNPKLERFAKPFLLLVNAEQIPINLLHAFPSAVFFRPSLPFGRQVFLPPCLNIWPLRKLDVTWWLTLRSGHQYALSKCRRLCAVHQICGTDPILADVRNGRANWLWTAANFNPRFVRLGRPVPRNAKTFWLARYVLKPKQVVVVAAIPDHDESKLTNFFQISEKANGLVPKFVGFSAVSILVLVPHEQFGVYASRRCPAMK
jgi:hypothetical protein